MSKLEDQISEYFTALHRGDVDDLAMPAYPVAEPHLPRRSRESRHRRTALAVAAIVAVAALATFGLVKSTEGSSPYVGTPGTDRPAPPPVPDGWKPVIVGSVQFSVPEEWPVVDRPRCDEIAIEGVYLYEIPEEDCAKPDIEFAAIAVEAQFDADSEIELSEMPNVASTDPPSQRARLQMLNGVRAIFRPPSSNFCDDCIGHTEVKLLDENVLIDLTFADPADADLAHQIIETIGAAPNSTQPTKPPIVEEPTSVPTTEPAVIPDDIQPKQQANPDAAEFCAAVEVFRQAGLTDPDTGLVKPEALPYFERMVATAPDDLRPAVETIRSWLAQGAPTPKPSEVGDAEMQTTLDWMNNCQG